MLKEINAAIRRHNAKQVAAIRKECITMKSDIRYAVRMWCLCVGLPCLALVAIGVIACATAHANQYAPVKVNCFNAADWNAPIKSLPCTTVVRPDNDMVRVIQGTAGYELAECVISTSEINDAVCHRTPKLRAAASVTPQVNTAGMKRVCNPASHVCIKVGRTAEDGSVRLMVYQFNWLRPIEACTLGNPSEERGAYGAPCEPLGVAAGR